MKIEDVNTLNWITYQRGIWRLLKKYKENGNKFKITKGKSRKILCICKRKNSCMKN